MKPIARVSIIALVVIFLVEALVFMGQGRTNIDEGMFLNAGRLVYDGHLLYRDFPFSQGPLVPYVYGAVLHVFGSSVLVGRVVSFLLALVSIGATLWIVRALGGRLAVAIAMILTIVNLPALWVAVTVRTQSLATPLVMLAAVALASGRRGVLGWAAAPSLLLWASAARVTTLVAFAAVTIWVGFQLRKSASLLLRVAAVVGVQALVIFSPMWLVPAASRFHVLTSQLTRGERFGAPPDLPLHRVTAKIGFFLQPETDFFPILPLTLAIAVYLGWSLRRGWRPDPTRPLGDPLTAQLTLVALAVLVFLPHLLLSQGFLTYFVTSSALLIPAIAIGVVHWCRESSRGAPVVLSIVAALLAVAFVGVPLHWSTWVGSAESSFSAFREVARDLREFAGPDCTMVTMETALAVETGCRLLPGLEYSAFSYRADLSDEEAKRWGVLNPKLLRDRVRELRPELIALGPTGFWALRRGLRGLEPPRAAAGGEPASLGFLDSGAYAFHATYPMSSGVRMGWTPDVVEVFVFKRNDLRSAR